MALARSKCGECVPYGSSGHTLQSAGRSKLNDDSSLILSPRRAVTVVRIPSLESTWWCAISSRGNPCLGSAIAAINELWVSPQGCRLRAFPCVYGTFEPATRKSADHLRSLTRLSEVQYVGARGWKWVGVVGQQAKRPGVSGGDQGRSADARISIDYNEARRQLVGHELNSNI